MSDNNNDDFWNSSSQDDFWKKPVAGDDWLKSDKKTDYSGLSEEFKTENPYVKSHIHQDSGLEIKQNKEKMPIVPDIPSVEKPKPRIHVRTIICLIAILIAVLSIITAVILVKNVKSRALSAAMSLTYKEEEVSGTFQLYENNRITLGNEAYTIVTNDNFTGFPEKLKLIAVYVEVESDQYIKDSYAMKDIYIGFEENGRNVYKKPAGSDMVYPYIYGYGFDSEQILGTYGVGNGFDCSGYYFFFVSEDADHITFYVEKKKTVNKVPIVDTLYIKDMAVLPEDEALTKQLAKRGGW
ncbi:MAG: hypothetical protein ACI4SD_07765 [Suilimivivens sp.]